MTTAKSFAIGGLLSALIVWLALFAGAPERETPSDSRRATPSDDGMVRLTGGTFRMGSDVCKSADERPAHDVSVGPFRMDTHEVTNRQFRRFVEATGYRTTAEQRGFSNVFHREREEWVRMERADWRHPGGPDTALYGRDEYPVVHVSWHDATAYAAWSDGRLPSEAQWEYAARSGLRDADFPWGHDELVDGRYRANTRQHGKQPDADGFDGPAPVASYPASRFGLYDQSGNVWEWCADWYSADFYRAGPTDDPTGPADGTHRIVRGGSYLSPENFRCGHHVSARHRLDPDATYAHVGFRCVD